MSSRDPSRNANRTAELVDEFKSDVAISYAGADHALAAELSRALTSQGLQVFFSPSQQGYLLGKRLEPELEARYSRETRFVAALISLDYQSGGWPLVEMEAALREEERRGSEVILPLLVDDVQLGGTLADRVYVDLRATSIEDAARMIVVRAREHRGELDPRRAFDRAYDDWKQHGFRPDVVRAGLFFRHADELELGPDRCAFLLGCTSHYAAGYRDMLARIDPLVLRAAAEKMYSNAEGFGDRLRAVRVLGHIDPALAEPRLMRIYEDPDIQVTSRADLLRMFWRCRDPSFMKVVESVLLDTACDHRLRRAAAESFLWRSPDNRTEAILRRALADPRQPVRAKVVDAIMRHQLEGLVPDLMAALERERSRRGASQLRLALRRYHTRADVIAFGRRTKQPPSFFRPPVQYFDWEQIREDWLG